MGEEADFEVIIPVGLSEATDSLRDGLGAPAEGEDEGATEKARNVLRGKVVRVDSHDNEDRDNTDEDSNHHGAKENLVEEEGEKDTRRERIDDEDEANGERYHQRWKGCGAACRMDSNLLETRHAS